MMLLISTYMLDSVPRPSFRLFELAEFRAEKWTTVDELPRKSCARQPGHAHVPSRDEWGQYGDAFPACGQAPESGRCWESLDTGRAMTKLELELAKNEVNSKAYRDFVVRNSSNPEFEGEFVAFVHGKFEGSDRSRSDLVRRMYDRFGNVCMYVGRSSGVEDVLTTTPQVLYPE